MSKKAWLLLAVVFAGIVAACVALYPAPSAEKIAFDRVEMGMSIEEVVALFGRRTLIQTDFLSGGTSARSGVWVNKTGDAATITFHNDVVLKSEWQESPDTLTARLRRWLPFLN